MRVLVSFCDVPLSLRGEVSARMFPSSHLLALDAFRPPNRLAVELAFLGGWLAGARKGNGSPGAAVILGLQWLALMPQLDERTLARIGGAEVSSSSLHYWWIAMDVARLALYGIIVAVLQSGLVNRHRSR